MKRVLIALTSHAELGDTGKPTGFYVSEAAEPWEALTAAGHRVDLVSVAGGKAPRDGENPDDPTQRAFLDAMPVDDTPAPGDLDPADYDAILFAGGHGAMWDFPGNPGLGALARGIYERGGFVAAVCHGPAGLVGLKLSDGSHLVDGKRVAAFTNEEETAVGLTDVVPFLLADRLVEQGATHVPGGMWEPNAIRDGRLITGQNPQSAPAVAKALVEALA